VRCAFDHTNEVVGFGVVGPVDKVLPDEDLDARKLRQMMIERREHNIRAQLIFHNFGPFPHRRSRLRLTHLGQERSKRHTFIIVPAERVADIRLRVNMLVLIHMHLYLRLPHRLSKILHAPIRIRPLRVGRPGLSHPLQNTRLIMRHTGRVKVDRVDRCYLHLVDTIFYLELIMVLLQKVEGVRVQASQDFVDGPNFEFLIPKVD